MTAIGNIGNQSILAASGMDLDAMGLEESRLCRGAPTKSIGSTA
jgi:hypothetical protein